MTRPFSRGMLVSSAYLNVLAVDSWTNTYCQLKVVLESKHVTRKDFPPEGEGHRKVHEP